MRLRLDGCVPARLRQARPAHQVSTVGLEGRSGVKNGKLLALAAGTFDAFVTVDKNLPYQQNTSRLPGKAKFWLTPSVDLAKNVGLSSAQVRQAQAVVEAHIEEIQDAWHRHFGG